MNKLNFKEGIYYGEINELNKPNGIGKMNFVDGSCYFGEWRNGKFEGIGKLIYASGNFYSGYFKKNMKDGFGCYYFPTKGERFEGFWRQNKKNGVGKFKYRNGQSYEGNYSDDMKEGFGVLNSNNIIYEGNWKKNLKDSHFNLHVKHSKVVFKTIFLEDNLINKKVEKENILTYQFQCFQKEVNEILNRYKVKTILKLNCIKKKFDLTKTKRIKKINNNKRESFKRKDSKCFMEPITECEE